jgi:hypothetical protein
MKLSPREHTIAEISQNHITHLGDIQSTGITCLRMKLNEHSIADI